MAQRQRPAGGAALLATYSFPSGHATATTAPYMTLVYLLWRKRLIPLFIALLAGVGWSFLVGVSRVYLGVRWATNVGGGWLLGLGLAMVAAAEYEWWRTRQVLRGGLGGASR